MLQYFQHTHLGIAFVVNKLSQFNHALSLIDRLFNAFLNICRAPFLMAFILSQLDNFPQLIFLMFIGLPFLMRRSFFMVSVSSLASLLSYGPLKKAGCGCSSIKFVYQVFSHVASEMLML